jgi:hypothetical protein
MYSKYFLKVLAGFALAVLIGGAGAAWGDEVRSGNDAKATACCACCVGTEVAPTPKHHGGAAAAESSKREVLPFSAMGSTYDWHDN